MFELLTALRKFLDDRRDLALTSLEDIMRHHGATEEELAREVAFYRGAWEEEAERQVAEAAAWLERGGASLQ